MKILALSLSIAVICFVIFFNISNISEAYGSGPPYYSQSINMDKWQNPIPVLLLVDTASALLIFIISRKFGLKQQISKLLKLLQKSRGGVR